MAEELSFGPVVDEKGNPTATTLEMMGINTTIGMVKQWYILRRQHTVPGEQLILCFDPHARIHPFVTWYMDEDGDVFMGHYWVLLTDAWKDFENRLAGNT